jgi:hypothetical protein
MERLHPNVRLENRKEIEIKYCDGWHDGRDCCRTMSKTRQHHIHWGIQGFVGILKERVYLEDLIVNGRRTLK